MGQPAVSSDTRSGVDAQSEGIRSLVKLIERRTPVLLPLAILLAGVGWLIALQRYWWFADDFLYLDQSKGATPDLAFLRVSNYGHFAPVTRFAYWVIANPLGLSHRWGTVMSAVVATLAVLLAYLIVRELLPERPLFGWLVLLPLATPALYRVLPWWGASIHVMVGLFWSQLALWLWLRHLRTDRLGYVFGAQLALAGGLLTQERPMFVVGVFFLLEFVTPPGNRPWFALPFRWKRELVRWVPLIGLVGLEMWNQLVNYPNDLPSPSTAEMVRYIRLAFVDYYLPGLFSIRVGAADSPSNILRWAAVGLLAVLVIEVLRRRRHAWRAPLFFLVTWMVHVGVVGAVKAGVRGAEGVASDAQYYVDATYLAIFSLMLALSQPRREVRRTVPRWFVVAGASALVAVMLFDVPSMIRIMDREIPGLVQGGPYWARAKDSLRLPAGSNRRQLAMRLPEKIAPTFVAPFNETTRVRKSFFGETADSEGSGTDLVATDATGRMRHIAPELLEFGNAAERLAAHALDVGRVIEPSRPNQVCFDPGGTVGTVDIRLKHAIPAPRWPWNAGSVYDVPVFFAVQYSVPQPTRLIAGSTIGRSLDMITYDLPPVSGEGVAIARLDPDGRADSAFLSRFTGHRVCVGNYAIFRPVALPLVPGGPCDRLALGGELEPNVACPPTRWDPVSVIASGSKGAGN